MLSSKPVFTEAEASAQCFSCQYPCCHNKFVWLTQEEGTRLVERSPQVVKGTDGRYMMMFIGQDCHFYREKQCAIHAERPQGCRDWPFQPEPHCLLWPIKDAS